jgi:hypothetical protein
MGNKAEEAFVCTFIVLMVGGAAITLTCWAIDQWCSSRNQNTPIDIDLERNGGLPTST